MTLPSILAYNDFLQDSAQYSTRTVTDSSDGSAVAAYPESNLFDRPLHTIWQRTGINASTAQRALLEFQFSLKEPYRLGAMVFGALNIQCVKESTGLPATSFDVRLTIGTTPGGTDVFDESYTHIGNNLASSRNSWFVHGYEVSEPEDSSANLAARAFGGTNSGAYFSLYITPNGTGNHTVSIGRVALMSGLAARAYVTSVGAGMEDSSQVQRAFGGTAYSNSMTPWRRRSATLVNLATREVFGGSSDGSAYWASTVEAVNLISGKAGDVAFLPFIAPPTTEGTASFGRVVMNCAAVFGFLDAPLQARLAAAVKDGDGAIWEAPFAIAEAT